MICLHFVKSVSISCSLLAQKIKLIVHCLFLTNHSTLDEINCLNSSSESVAANDVNCNLLTNDCLVDMFKLSKPVSFLSTVS